LIELKLANSGFIDIDHEDIMNLEKTIFDQLRYKRYLLNIKDKIDAVIGKDVNLSKPENRKSFEAVLEKYDLPDPNKLISKEALLTYHYIKCVSFISKRIFKKSKEHSRQLIALFENNEAFKKKHSIWYKKSLCKHVECCFWTQEFEDYPTTVIKINGLKTNTDEMKTEIFKTVKFYSLLYNLQMGMLVQAEAQVEHIEAHWKKHEKEIQDNRKLAIYYNTAILFFLREKWEKSLEWLDKITNFHLTEGRRDIQLTARIIKVLITYEINTDEVDKAYNTANKYLTRNDHYFEFEQALINHFRALEKSINSKEKNAIFIKFKAILEKLNKTDQLGFQEILLWVESKVTGTSIEQIFLEKIEKNRNRGIQTDV